MNLNKRNVCVISAVLGAMAIGGCQPIHNIPPDTLDDTPIPVDAAMERREWDESRASYANTGVWCSPTLFSFQSAPGHPDYQYALTEMPVFVVNVLLIPVQVFISPAWHEREYRAATIPPSYSAMPALPPAKESTSEAQPAPSEEPAPSDRPADQAAPR